MHRFQGIPLDVILAVDKHEERPCENDSIYDYEDEDMVFENHILIRLNANGGHDSEDAVSIVLNRNLQLDHDLWS